MYGSMKRKICYISSFILVLLVFLFIVTLRKITVAPTINPLPAPAKVQKQIGALSLVVDGDTIIINGKTKVRYIGIDTPELKTGTTVDQCFARPALEENRKLLEGKRIYMEKDVSETDKYGRLLRYVWAGPATGKGPVIFINDYLIRNGYARFDVIPPDTKFYQLFKSAEQEAKINKRGLWGLCPTS